MRRNSSLPKRRDQETSPKRRVSRAFPPLTDRIRGLLKGSRLSTEAVLDAYETSLVDAGLGD